MTTDVSPAEPGRALAPFGRRLLTVTANETLGAYRVLKAADPDGPEPAAGQFAMLAAAERWGAGEDERPYVPRAFSYARFQNGEAHFLLEEVGPGTRRLCELGEGDGLWLLGPLGQGFSAPEQGRRALLVGGGVGIAPLAIWQDKLKAGEPHQDDSSQAGAGLHSDRPCATVLLGFRDSAHTEGAALLEDAVLASDDGSVGHHGRVTELLCPELDRDAQTTVYACGPPPMLESVRALCAERDVPAQLALEAGMACGFGACYGCVVPAREGYLRVCIDGPVVDASELEQVSDHAGAPG
jgi:dihydroorotate dehydrogenase electron transfer subunit